MKKITLSTPLQRGEQTIETISLRCPKAGELRGLEISSLVRMDYSQLEVLIPRISDPMITPAEIAELEPYDMSQLASEVTNFLILPQPKFGELAA